MNAVAVSSEVETFFISGKKLMVMKSAQTLNLES